MNTENSKTDEPNILRLILSGELDLTLCQIGWGNPLLMHFFYCEKLRRACGLPQVFREPNLLLHVF